MTPAPQPNQSTEIQTISAEQARQMLERGQIELIGDCNGYAEDRKMPGGLSLVNSDTVKAWALEDSMRKAKESGADYIVPGKTTSSPGIATISGQVEAVSYRKVSPE